MGFTTFFLFISLVAFLHRQEKFLKLFTSLLLFLLAFGALALFSSQFFDTGYDTRAYHTKAILGLLDGINPYYEPKIGIIIITLLLTGFFLLL